jgi:hypothetical protein
VTCIHLPQLNEFKEQATRFGFPNHYLLIWYKPNKIDQGGNRLCTQHEFILIINNYIRDHMQFSCTHTRGGAQLLASIRSTVITLDTVPVIFPTLPSFNCVSVAIAFVLRYFFLGETPS